MHSFTTERLLIRAIEKTDLSMYLDLYCNKKTMRNIGPTLTPQIATEAFERTVKSTNTSPSQSITWSIVSLVTGKAIGIQNLNWGKASVALPDASHKHTAEIGLMLQRSNHGKGIPEEAAKALIEYAFKNFDTTRINAIYAKRNRAVARVAKKLGFIYPTDKQPLDESYELQYIDKVE